MAPILHVVITINGILLTTNQDLEMKTNAKLSQAGPTITPQGRGPELWTKHQCEDFRIQL
jgi:hypothetical protein